MMSVKLPLSPENDSDQFGSPNALDGKGGIFEVDYTAAQEASESSEKTGSGDEKNGQPDQKKSRPATKKRSPLRAAVVVCALALAVALSGAVLYGVTHALIGSLFGDHVFISTSEKQVDLSGSGFDDYAQLSRLKKAEEIDLTGSSLKDLTPLYECESLKKVILSDRVLSASECLDFYAHRPEARLVCRVDIEGDVYDADVTELTVQSVDADKLPLFGALKGLTSLDLTGCDVPIDTFRNLSGSLPDCLILMNVDLCGRQYRTDEEKIVLKGTLTEEDVEKMEYFIRLTQVDARECANPDLLAKFADGHPNVVFNRPIQILGREFFTLDEMVDLRGQTYSFEDVKAALDEAVPKMPSLKKVDLCGCGLNNQEMEQLCAAYPDVKVVWMISLYNGRWRVRTDAVAFSTLTDARDRGKVYTEKVFADLFTYCTDLVAVDLGHTRVHDMTLLANDKKIRAVIFTDTKINDISPFAQLKDLEFIEMNVNRVQSVEPLRDLEKVKYINLYSSMAIKDLSPLYHHSALELCIFHRTVSEQERARFKESNPDCEAYYTVDSVKVTTNDAWRKNPYRLRLKEAFTNWPYVTGFNEETGEYIFDYGTDQYKYD